jgi:Na+/H+ ion antiporter subunit
MRTPQPEAMSRILEIAARTALYFGFWLMISGVSPADLPVGLAAAMAATWVSLCLLPARASRLQFSLKFLRQGVVSGTDVAWRALRPRLQLRSGFVACPLHLPPGGERSSSLKRRRRNRISQVLWHYLTLLLPYNSGRIAQHVCKLCHSLVSARCPVDRLLNFEDLSDGAT